MPRRKEKAREECCPTAGPQGRYEVEAVATVDDRGQMVLPKAIREKAGIKAGDRLAIVTLVRDGKVCCLHLFRSEDLASGVREILEPKGG
jgi:antitoxin PrlF